MTENMAGITALITAYARAYHATHADPKIFDDFLIDQIYTPEEHASFDQSLASTLKLIDPELAAAQPDQASALASVIQIQNGPITLSRSRYAEDALAGAIRQGIRQYVILGAGMDTFAYRRPDLAPTLQVFAVDHPITQAMARQRFSAAGWPPPANLHWAPIDFTKESLAEALGRTPYDPDQPTFFSWLGVTYYLARPVIDETLRAIARLAPRGSPVVFDYLDEAAFLPGQTDQRVQFLLWIASQVGEPMKSGFDPRALAADLAACGFNLAENLTPSEIEARYFSGRQDRYHAFEHIHFALAEVDGRRRT